MVTLAFLFLWSLLVLMHRFSPDIQVFFYSPKTCLIRLVDHSKFTICHRLFLSLSVALSTLSISPQKCEDWYKFMLQSEAIYSSCIMW